MITPNRKNSAFIPEVLNVLFGDEWAQPVRDLRRSIYRSFEPAINLIENDEMYKIEMATPGMQKDDLNVIINNEGELVVAVEKKEAKAEPVADDAQTTANEPKDRYLRQDFSFAKFTQTFTLPEDVELQGISARMADGILTIALPKKKPAAPVDNTRYIEVM